jgi:hypothetical protein
LLALSARSHLDDADADKIRQRRMTGLPDFGK